MYIYYLLLLPCSIYDDPSLLYKQNPSAGYPFSRLSINPLANKILPSKFILLLNCELRLRARPSSAKAASRARTLEDVLHPVLMYVGSWNELGLSKGFELCGESSVRIPLASLSLSNPFACYVLDTIFVSLPYLNSDRSSLSSFASRISSVFQLFISPLSYLNSFKAAVTRPLTTVILGYTNSQSIG